MPARGLPCALAALLLLCAGCSSTKREVNVGSGFDSVKPGERITAILVTDDTVSMVVARATPDSLYGKDGAVAIRLSHVKYLDRTSVSVTKTSGMVVGSLAAAFFLVITTFVILVIGAVESK